MGAMTHPGHLLLMSGHRDEKHQATDACMVRAFALGTSANFAWVKASPMVTLHMGGQGCLPQREGRGENVC